MDEAEAKKLGLKDEDFEIEKFISANSQELAKVRILVFRTYWILDTGYWILDTGYWIGMYYPIMAFNELLINFVVLISLFNH